MIRGLLRKILVETWVQLAGFALAIFIVGTLLTMLLPQLEQGANQVLATLPFVRKFLQALLGERLGATINAETIQSIIWVHPTVLALLWAQETVFCTRVPAGEIDRGTIDVLLSWPFSRRKLFAAETFVWLTSGLALVLALLLGHFIGRSLSATDTPHSWKNVFRVAANLYSVYIAVGGIALLVSSISDRRGRAMAGVFGLVLASFLLNFLVQFWTAVEVFSWLSVLNYYRPSQILATGQLPVRDIVVLLSVGVTAWLAALEIFARRNISTV
jgi:ABC-type transport system involved in multi-copper enzyme maturation permease subunit